MKFFPPSTLHQLEFDKVKELLVGYCRSEFAKAKALDLRIHTKIEFIETELSQGNEYKQLLQSGQYLPNDFMVNVSREIKLLGIPGAALKGDQFLLIRRLADTTGNIFRWFDTERALAYPSLFKVIAHSYYEKLISKMIDAIVDETGNIKDNASEELASIRLKLFRKRNELRKAFDRIVQKMNKQGYLADIEESFMNGRRVLAVFAEQKRMIKGVLHGESDSRRTSFIEPEETTELNNDIFSLEYEESKELYRILRELTGKLSIYATLLQAYMEIAGEYDFIQAKARLAIDTGGNFPRLHNKALLELKQAYHPLLLLYNQKAGKPTIPVDISLNDTQRILVISGPNQ